MPHQLAPTPDQAEMSFLQDWIPSQSMASRSEQPMQQGTAPGAALDASEQPQGLPLLPLVSMQTVCCLHCLCLGPTLHAGWTDCNIPAIALEPGMPGEALRACRRMLSGVCRLIQHQHTDVLGHAGE